MKNIQITIVQASKTGGATKVKKLVVIGQIVENNFDEHDTAGALFALEFAANNHSEIPMRVHITPLN